MEGDADTSWREKLARLRKLPRPSQNSSRHDNNNSTQPYTSRSNSIYPTTHRSAPEVTSIHPSMQRSSEVNGFQLSVSSSRSDKPKLGTLHLEQILPHQPRIDTLHWDHTTMYSSTNAVPDCLNTFSAFYDPSVSAAERFEYYLQDLHYRSKSKHKSRSKTTEPTVENSIKAKSLPHNLPDKNIVTGELRCSLMRERQISKSDTLHKTDNLHKKYSPGNKGGGWKVVPQISRQDLMKYYHFEPRQIVTISTPAPITKQHSSL